MCSSALSSYPRRLASGASYLPDKRAMRWRRDFGQLTKVGSTSLKDGLYDWEAEEIFG